MQELCVVSGRQDDDDAGVDDDVDGVVEDMGFVMVRILELPTDTTSFEGYSLSVCPGCLMSHLRIYYRKGVVVQLFGANTMIVLGINFSRPDRGQAICRNIVDRVRMAFLLPCNITIP